MMRIKVILLLLILSFCSFAQNKERILELEKDLETESSLDRIAEITFELSTLFEDSVNLAKAIKYAKTSVEVSESINYTTKQIKSIHQLGKLYSLDKDYEKALFYHNQALAIAKEYTSQKEIAIAYINIGKVYTEAKNEELAKENFLNALKVGDKIKNPLIKSIANSSLGDLSKEFKKFNIATQFYLEALDYSLQTNNYYLQGIAYKNVAIMQKKTNQSEESLGSLKNALKKFELIDDQKELAEINFFLGEYYNADKDFDNAIIYMKNSLGFAELSGHQDYIKKGYENLAVVYEKNNDYKNAYDYLKYFSAIKDTKFISELEAQIAQIEIEKKNKEIDLINQNSQFERIRTYILLSVAILILLFSLVLYYNLRQKNIINKELKLATEAANKSKKEKEEFFTFTSHEIRTPLNAVVGMTQLLAKTTLNEVQRKYLKTIKTSSKNILFLVNDVLDLAKLEKGAIKLESVDTSLTEIVTDIEDALSFKLNEKPVQLNFHIDTNIPDYIKGDPLRINQILLNLTDNAIKFTKKGTVSLTVKVVGETSEAISIYFEVKDTGIGITKEKLEKIFESYEQASVDTARHYGGTGLGLAITKQLIELMGSKIEIKSELAVGTSFSFTIVFNKSETTSNLLHDNTIEHLANVTILAVDDTDLNRSIFYDLIHSKENNVNVVLAEDGEKALEACLKQQFDVIMMDLQMPILNGFETTERIRKDPNNPNKNTPIIAMTAHVLEGVSKRCDAVGMNDYIAKPINISLLHQKIKLHVQQSTTIKVNPNSVSVLEEEQYKDSTLTLKTANIDLTGLSELVGGKEDKIIKYIDLFLKNVPKDFAILKQQFASQQWEECGKTAHKIKGNASYMGIEQAKELLVQVEKMKEEVAQVDKNRDIVVELEAVLRNASQDLISLKTKLIT